MAEILAQLKRTFGQQQTIQIYRDRLDPNSICGIPLQFSDDLCLIQVLYDFQFDGYTIVRLPDITSISMDENQRFMDYILEKEGLFTQVTKSPLGNVSNWNSVFNQLRELGNNIIVECEKEDEEEDFFVGRIEKVNDISVSLLYFNPLGVWDVEPTEIKFEDITLVSLNTRYIEVFSKYVRSL